MFIGKSLSWEFLCTFPPAHKRTRPKRSNLRNWIVIRAFRNFFSTPLFPWHVPIYLFINNSHRGDSLSDRRQVPNSKAWDEFIRESEGRKEGRKDNEEGDVKEKCVLKYAERGHIISEASQRLKLYIASA